MVTGDIPPADPLEVDHTGAALVVAALAGADHAVLHDLRALVIADSDRVASVVPGAEAVLVAGNFLKL